MLLQGEEEAVQLLLRRIREGTVWIQVENLTVQYPDNDTGAAGAGIFNPLLSPKFSRSGERYTLLPKVAVKFLLSFGQCRYTNRLRIMV